KKFLKKYCNSDINLLLYNTNTTNILIYNRIYQEEKQGGEFVHSLGRKLWKNHHDTKKLLRFFLPISGSQGSVEDIAKGSSAAAGKEPENPRRRLTKTQVVGLILGPVLFVLTLLFCSPEGLSKEGVAIAASTLWVGTWWITEAAPIAVTSLLPIVLFPLTGGL